MPHVFPVPSRLAVAAVLLAAPACSDGGTGTPPREQVASVTVAPATQEVLVGSTVTYTATARSQEGNVVSGSVAWSTGSSSIATVAGGAVTGVGAGTTTVRASVDGVAGEATVVVRATTPPAAPSGVTATALSDVAVGVSWLDNASDEQEFRIERGAEAGAPAFSQVGTAPANATSWRDDTASPATVYFYRVRACNAFGCRPGEAEGGATSAPVTTHETLQIVTGAQLPSAVLAEPYDRTLQAQGGDGAFTWSVTGGALPAGVGLEASGLLSGTPTEGGTFAFDATVTSGEQSLSRAFTLVVDDEPQPLEIVTDALAEGVVGTAYADALEAKGGRADYVWSLESGTLPPGVDLAGNGAVTGTPTQSGPHAFTVRVTSGDESVTKQVTLRVWEALTVATPALPDATANTPYATQLDATGGDGGYTWSLPGGQALPAGLVLQSTGVLEGTPLSEGDRTFNVVVVSGDGQTATATFDLVILPPPVEISTWLVPGASVGESYAFGFASEGTLPAGEVTWSLEEGELPAGLALVPATGELSGTPAGAGVSYFTLAARGGGGTSTRTFAMAVSANPSSAFNMWVMNVAVGTTLPAPEVQAAVSQAVRKWDEVITGELPDVAYGDDQWSSGALSGHAAKLNGQAVDDMVVLVDLEPIDGPGGTLGSAGWFNVRSTTDLDEAQTVFGRLRLDTEDLTRLDEGQRVGLVFHEIGHVVGIGTLWNLGAGLELRTGCTAVPRYLGSEGNAVWLNEMDGGSQGSTEIPIEGEGGGGTACGHWDEGELDREVMTGWIESAGTAMPLSRMTVASLKDLGYVVDVEAGVDYQVPACAPGCVPVPSADPGFSVGDDIDDGGGWVTLPDGRTIRLAPRRD